MPFCTPVRARVAGTGRPTKEGMSSRNRLRIYGHWVSALNMQRSITTLGSSGTPQDQQGVGEARVSRIPKSMKGTPTVLFQTGQERMSRIPLTA